MVPHGRRAPLRATEYLDEPDRGAWYEYDCAMAGVCRFCQVDTMKCACAECDSCMRVWDTGKPSGGYDEGGMRRVECPPCRREDALACAGDAAFESHKDERGDQ